MLNVGISEFLVFAVIALLVLGPDKLPEALRFVGKWYSKGKRFVSNIQNDIDHELRVSELKDQMQKEMQRIAALEQKMQSQMDAFGQLNTHKATTQLKQYNYTPVKYLRYGYTTHCVSLTTHTASNTQTQQAHEPIELKVAV